MAPLHSITSLGSHSAKYKESKSKAKPAVKPILKKWAQSDKEKKSIDLDRGWDEQQDATRNGTGTTRGWGRESSLSYYDRITGMEVEGPFAVGGGGGVEATGTGAGGSGGGGVGLGVVGGATNGRRFNHARSISGTSHGSIATSNSSNGVSVGGPRPNGAYFVHPFQQTPRTSTPPLLSYANSLASIPDTDTRDYSPTTITEDDDDGSGFAEGTESPTKPYRPYQQSTSLVQDISGHPSIQNPRHSAQSQVLNNSSHSLSQKTSLSLKRPSIASHRTSSFPDENSGPAPKPSSQQPSLRVKISSRAPSIVPSPSSRLANVSSRSDLNLELSTSTTFPTTVASAPNTMTPISPLRTSLDSGFRLRAKSDLDTATRAEHLRAARKKFEEKERIKDEKFAREEIKRRNRADNKRAQELEKQLAARHKEQLAAKVRQEAAELEEALQRGRHNRKISIASSARPSLSIARPSMSVARPSMSQKDTPSSQIGEMDEMGQSEKFMSSSYDNADPRSPPSYGEEPAGAQAVHFSSSKRRSTKKKTQSAWTAFMLWLRTKLLRMAKN
ncbi:hypothetical protein GGS20DRAFT_15524 [Poronia punctata]|nr:hypothetical protein GGS20DRAFT_15524 [Poronia punctata]